MIRQMSILVALAILGLTGTSGVTSRDNSGDIVQIYQLQATFHRSATTKNLDLMMSLWADDATMSTGDNQGYEGKHQIRHWFATRYAAFRPENHWVSLGASPKVRIDLQGRRASLSFECHYIDLSTRLVKLDTIVNTTLARINGKWLITDAVFGPASL